MVILAVALLAVLLYLWRRYPHLVSLLGAVALMLAPSVAEASSGSSVNDVIRDYLHTIAVGAVTGLVSWIGAKVGKLLGGKARELTEQALRGIANAAVDYAEQRATRWLKENGVSMTSDAKKELAVGFAIDLARRQGIKSKAVERVGDLIEAALGRRRIGW